MEPVCSDPMQTAQQLMVGNSWIHSSPGKNWGLPLALIKQEWQARPRLWSS